MKSARLYGPQDIRIDEIQDPPSPAKGEIVLRVGGVGVCGSDLHWYKDAGIGATRVKSPFIMGHEFGGEVIAVGEDALDGNHEPLKVGQRVAVDPCTPCYTCEMCEKGHPNLCPNHTFYGQYPLDGALQECMIVNARNCFPIPDSITDGGSALLETLGVAIHAVDFAKIKVANSVSVIGCGPVGLLILRLAKLAGADPIYAFDRYSWRVDKALAWGATEAFTTDACDPVEIVMKRTNGRGVDIAFEAAWADETVQQSADMLRPGGRLMLVGIPDDDQLQLNHSVARRKGLTIIMSRRMKHTYPRAIQMATNGMVDLDDLISHEFALDEAPVAFKKNLAYEEGVHKIVINVSK